MYVPHQYCLSLTQEDCTLSIDAVYRLLTNGVAQMGQLAEESLYQVSIVSTIDYS